MKEDLAAVLAIALLGIACASARDDSASHERAKQIWKRNMTIVQESVDSWKKRSGTAAYAPKELENAITFFETVTGIHGGNMSFIGPIPDASLEKLSDEWLAWYAVHGEHLRYSARTRRVIVLE